MKVYADSEARRLFQMAGDVLLLVWIYVWIQVAVTVRDATLSLGTPGEELASASASLADRLRDAGTTVGDLPVVGDAAGQPFEGAGDAADKIAGAGQSQVEAVETLAFWLSLAVAAIPILIALAVYLPPRLRFVRRATAGQKFIDATEDLDLFALRAMTRQPLHRLASISDDPAGAWRARDSAVIGALAELELKESGLSPPQRIGQL